MNMVCIGMHREKHLKTFAVYKMFSEIQRYLECGFVIDIIQRVK